MSFNMVGGKPPQLNDVISNTFRGPALWPESMENEELKKYVVGVKKGFPFFSFHLNIGGRVLTFSQYVLPRAAGRAENDGVRFDSNIVTTLLTDKQRDAYIERAKKCKRRVSPKHKKPDNMVTFFDGMILMEAEQYFQEMHDENKFKPEKLEESVVAPPTQAQLDKALLNANIGEKEKITPENLHKNKTKGKK